MSTVIKNTATNSNTEKAAKVAATVNNAKAATAAPITVNALKWHLIEKIASGSAALKAIIANDDLFQGFKAYAAALETVAAIEDKPVNTVTLGLLDMVKMGYVTEGQAVAYLSYFSSNRLTGANLMATFKVAVLRPTERVRKSLEVAANKATETAKANQNELLRLEAETAAKNWQRFEDLCQKLVTLG